MVGHYVADMGYDSLGNSTGKRLTLRKNDFILKIVVYCISIILLFVSMFPFFKLLVEFTGFKIKNPATVLKVIPKRFKQLKNFFDADVTRAFINSVLITTFSTILNIYFSALTAHSIYAYKWKGRKVFSNFIMALMMIPGIVAEAGFVTLAYRFHLDNNILMLILPSIATPISVVFMRLYLESAFSMELIYSARIDGAGEFRIFNQIVLPLLKPAIATQAIFSIASTWNEVYKPLVLLTRYNTRTLPIMLLFNQALGYDQVVPLMVSTVPVLIAYLILSRNIIEGVQLGSVKM